MASLQEILSSAFVHPIYTPLLKQDSNEAPAPLSLTRFPFLEKDHLIQSFQTLIHTDPAFLHSAYLSPTGGTHGGATQLYFVTATSDNRTQRRLAAEMLSNLHIFDTTDIVMNLHLGAYAMYRAQGLTSALIDLADGTELSIGGIASDAEVLEFARIFKPNSITSPSSRVLQLARYVAGLPEEERITVRKVVYSSEPLLPGQEAFLHEALGVELIGSLYGSAEAGPWAGSPPVPIRKSVEQREEGDEKLDYREFVFDRKQMVVEIIDTAGKVIACSLPESEASLEHAGEMGEIVLTSLCRIRNPLVRYKTGDLGSLHLLSKDISLKDESKREDYVQLRLYGRNPLTSFFIDAEYIDIIELQRRVFDRKEHDVLEWQVIVAPLTEEMLRGEPQGTNGDALEFRVVTKRRNLAAGCVENYERRVKRDIVENVIRPNVKITVRKVEYEELERGRNARKVIKVLDLRK